ncbi:MFS transporter [Actinocorallia lasiicapitis]
MTQPAGAPAAERTERYRDALAVPEFRVIFLVQVITFVGVIMADFATTVLVFRKTGSPLLASLVLALAFTPYLFAGPLLSSLVDRVPLRRLMVAGMSLTGLIAAAMAIPGMPVPALLGMVFLIGTVSPVLAGARSATLPQVLPGPAYVPARSLLRIVAQSAQVFGLAAGGVLLTVVEPHTALLAEAVAFGFAALIMRFGTKERRPATPAGKSMVRDSLAGIKAVLALRPLRRNLVLGWIVAALSVTPEALALPYAAEAGIGTAWIGVMMAALPLGCALGEFAVMRALTPTRQIRAIVPLAVLVLAPLLGYALKPGLAGVVLLLFASGAGVGHHLGQDHQLIKVTPADLRSRALAVQTMGLMFFQGAGFATAGLAAEFTPVSVVVPVSAAAGLIAVALLRPTRK